MRTRPSSLLVSLVILLAAACSDSDTVDGSGGGGTVGGQGGTSTTGGNGGTGMGVGGGVGGAGATGGMGGAGGSGGEMNVVTLTDLDPDSGIVTTEVTITGAGFGATQGTSTVTIGGEVGTPSSWSDTSIVVPVPDTLFPADHDVVVTVGSTASSPLPFAVLLPRTVYVGNDNASPNTSVSAYAMDDTGMLTALTGSPYLTGDAQSSYGGDSSMVVLHRGTRRLFVTGNGAVAVFDIDAVTGELAAVTGSPFDIGSARMFGLTVDAAGEYLYVTGLDSDDIAVLSIDTAGALTPVSGSPFASLAPVTAHLLQGETLLAAANEQQELYVYTIDAGTKALTPVTSSPFAIAETFTSQANPAGTRIYVPGATTLEAYDVDAAGAVTAVAGSPLAVTADTLHSIELTADGARLYAGEYGGDDLFVFDIDTATGAPTELATSPFVINAGSGNLGAMDFTRNDAFLVIVHESANEISVVSIATDGTPTEITGSPFTMDVLDSGASGLVVAE